jgi:hypothetical protein
MWVVTLLALVPLSVALLYVAAGVKALCEPDEAKARRALIVMHQISETASTVLHAWRRIDVQRKDQPRRHLHRGE